ncbi:MAG: hypothetical protein ABXS92_07335, partial [Sulfurimonas sp.]
KNLILLLGVVTMWVYRPGYSIISYTENKYIIGSFVNCLKDKKYSFSLFIKTIFLIHLFFGYNFQKGDFL